MCLNTLTKGTNIPYVVPASRMVRILRRRFHRGGSGEQRFRFFTFDQFVRQLSPVAQKGVMTPVAQELLVQQAVARVKETGGFRYFAGVTDRPGWLKQVEAKIGEIKRAGVRPGRLQQLWEEQGEKYRELVRIYQVYQDLLEESGGLDHEEAYFQVCDTLRRGEGKGALPEEAIFELFSDLTFMQQEVLIQLVTAGVKVSVHLVRDDHRPRLFQETDRALERLRQRGFLLREVPPLREGKRKKAVPLAVLEERAFSPRPVPVAAEGTVEVIAAAGEEKEVEEVVARLKGWLRTSGAALSDAAVVVNDPDTYTAPLVSALEAAGLPCEQGRSCKLRDHPLMQTLLAALELRQGKEEKRSELLESPYFPRSGEEGAIQVYRQLGKPGSEQELNRRLSRRDGSSGSIPKEELEGLRSLYRWVEEIPLQAPWREWAEWFSKWADRLKREEEWPDMARDPELLPVLAGEVDVWKRIGEVLEEWRRVFDSTELGEGKCDLRSFIAGLERAAEGKEVRLSPGRRGGVHLLQPNQLGGDRYRAVIMLGCAEGRWPRPIREDWLIPDEERMRLRKEGVRFATSSELRAQRLLPFYQSARVATELLVFSYPSVTPEGKQQLTSPYLDELLEVFTKESVVRVTSHPGELLPARWEDCLSLSRGVEKAVDVLTRSGERDPDTRRALEVIRHDRWKRDTDHRQLRERIRVERLRWGRGYSSFDGVLESSPLQQELGSRLKEQVWSATRLNELMQCRFHFLAGRIWGALPRESVETGLSSLERGEIFHRILCRFWDRYRSRPFDTNREEEIREHLLAVAEGVFAEVTEAGDGEQRDPFRFRIEKNRLLQRLFNLLDHEIGWRKEVNSDWSPRYLELAFGMQIDAALAQRGEIDPETRTAPAEVRLHPDISLRLQGKVDRVDLDSEGHYIIYDYKSGSAPGAADIQSGSHLQLPLYLWVLQEVFGLPREKAWGVAYFTAGQPTDDGRPPRDNRNRGLWRKEGAPQAGIGSRVGGLLEEEEWDKVQERIRLRVHRQLKRAIQGDFAVAPAGECPSFCPHRTLCRIDDLRMTQKELPGEGGEEDG